MAKGSLYQDLFHSQTPKDVAAVIYEIGLKQ